MNNPGSGQPFSSQTPVNVYMKPPSDPAGSCKQLQASNDPASSCKQLQAFD